MTEALLDIDIIWQQDGRSARAQFSLIPGITALIGPSGAGKTTLARMITGLADPRGGSIRFKGRILFQANKNRNIPAAARNIGLVMQNPSLFPHLTVLKNVSFAAGATPETISAAMETLGVTQLSERMPSGLSGGEARRVTLARALAACPDLLILDEPMNGLDPKARIDILSLIKRMSRASGVPVLLITHQLEDMLAVADHAILMAPGKTVAAGSLEEIVAAPECAELLGLSDAGQLLTATVARKDNELICADINGADLFLTDGGEPIGSKVTLRIMSTDVSLARSKIPDISIINQLPARIHHIEETEAFALVHLELDGTNCKMTSKVTRHTIGRLELKVGDPIWALVKAVSVKDIVL